jgi:TfoX/Sxy family transcriptional regulator of competence genes
MAWVKIPKEHHPILEAALPDDDRIDTKSMFGGLAVMANGQMMGGLWGMSAIVKLSPADHAELVRLGGVPFDPMGNGRAMADMLVMPESEFADRARLAGWLTRARDYVVTLPPKRASPTKQAAPAKKVAAAKAAPKAAAKEVPATKAAKKTAAVMKAAPVAKPKKR